MSGQLVEEGGRWEVSTDRSQETHRMGYGIPDLEVVLEHLARRGDRRCSVWTDSAQSWVEVSLPRPVEP